MRRFVTSVVLAAFALSCIFFAPAPLLFIVVAGVACLCYREFARIARGSGVEGPLGWGMAAGVAAMIWPESIPVITVLVLSVALGLQDLGRALGFAAAVALGLVYIFLPWRNAWDLRLIHPYWLFFALAINWIGDVAAYFTGRKFGRHKLAPRVSPGKSIEGAVGSMFASAVFGVAFAVATGIGTSMFEVSVLSVLANAAGQAGDLAESAMKRGAGVKDSGTLLPGHGGVLDRLDSSLFSLPVVYAWLQWVSPLFAGGV
ncbi:MAG TPA: phosphatidate cytidylyltransferase [Bryobacteraceae bacterium]|nr:phosphatidate cytidylyltransferase [Bryobacteraceae bacterium]